MEYNLVKELDELSHYYNDNLEPINGLIRECQKWFSKEDILKIIKAYKCANDLHRGQVRASGEAYIIHPVNVAYNLLTEIHLIDADAICAALLHDTIEDTGITEKHLAELFNPEIAYLVAGVSKIKDLNFTSKREEEKYNDCILLRSCAKDIRIIMIKIADRLHNMRTLIYKGDKDLVERYQQSKMPIEEFEIIANNKQKLKCAETITLFVPLAERIGCYNVARELENLSNMYLQNDLYRYLNKEIKDFINKHIDQIEKILEELGDLLLNNHIDHVIRVQAKTFSEVNDYFNRNQNEVVKLSDVPGLISFEINVDNKNECYRVLEVLLKKYGKYEIEIKDYIKMMKANGYRAIHLKLRGLSNQVIEFKICSRKMKLINDYGLSALTEIYPDNNIKKIQDSLKDTNPFIMSLQSIDELYKDNNSYIHHIEEEILAAQITILSKDGDEFVFPLGSTVLDFAFRLHSEIGNHAVGAIVNKKVVTNNYILNDGDKVEIITDDKQLHQPWKNINFVKTSYARREMRRSLKKQ